MFPDIAAIRARLASVDAELAQLKPLPADISPEQFLKELLDTARRHPVQGTAFALQALESPVGPVALGIALAWWGYYTEALAFLERVDQPDALDLYRCWYRIICERRLRRVDDCFDQLLDVADTLENKGDSHAAMRCRLDAISTLYLSQADNDRLREIIHYFETNNLPGDLGIGLILRTFELFNQGDLAAGLDTLERAEAIFVEQDMPAMLAYAWMYRGLYFYHRREFEEADSWFQKAQRQAEALKHEYYLALILLERARLYYEKGDIPASLEIYLKAADLSEKQKLIHLDADCQISIANLKLRQGDYSAAVEGYRQAESLFTELGNETFAAIARMNLGVVARRQGDFTRSLNEINQALAIFQGSRALEHQANAQYNLGKTYAAFGYFEPAIEHYQNNIALLQEAGLEAAAVRPSIDLAHIMIQRGLFDQAAALLDQAERLAAEQSLDSALCLRTQAELMVAQGKTSDALQAYQDSQEQLASLQQYEAVRETTLSIAELLVALGRINAAWEELNRLDQKKLSANAQWHYHIIRAKIAQAQEEYDNAQEIYLEALRTIQAARRTLLQEEQVAQFNLMLQPAYEDALGLALEQDDPAAALSIVELSGTQLLNIRLGIESTLTDQDWLSESIAALTAEFNREWTILRYAWFQDSIRLFALTPDGLASYPINLDSSMWLALKACSSPDNTFRRFTYLGHSQIQPNAVDISRRNLQQLYRLLLPDGIRSRLQPEHTLIVVPTHQLHGLAFQALLDGDVPLIEQTRLLYAQSLGLLAASSNRPAGPPPDGQGLILAQPEFTLPGYQPLPHVRLEANTIREIAGETVEIWPSANMNQAALSQAALAGDLSRYDWLHIATHSYVEPATGTFAGLVLGSDVLKLDDIHRWQLNARLVTLSACQTGLGRWYYGDELAGLSQAFLGAGVQTVIASLWLAADQQTADFMAILYRHLRQVSDPITALAQAQREAQRSGLAPYYWAPFCVFGRP